MEELNSDNFDSAISKEGLSLVVFTAPWCGPCKVLKPRLPDIVSSSGKNVSLYVVDIESNNEFSKRYGIRAVPFVMTVRDGDVVESTATGSSQEVSNMLSRL
jgi:thioredoxin-like negative regulator of GroEL